MPLHSRKSVVLITGCSGGIGRSLAFEFASRGMRVIATAREASALQELEDLHENIHARYLDLKEPGSIEALRDDFESTAGHRLDILINNAGAHYASPALDINASKAFSSHLISSKGVIVQIGSVTRSVPVVCQSPYNATKAALSQYTNTLRLELEPFGVRVVEVVTGYVQSNILRNGLQAPPNSLYKPILDHIENIKNSGNAHGMPAPLYAKRVVDAVTQPNPRGEIWEGGKVWSLWLVVRWLPQWISRLLWRKVFHLDRLGEHDGI